MPDRHEEQTSGATASSGNARKVLERHPRPGSDQKLVLVEITYPPGGVAPAHHHLVAGLLYIVEGVAESAS